MSKDHNYNKLTLAKFTARYASVLQLNPPPDEQTTHLDYFVALMYFVHLDCSMKISYHTPTHTPVLSEMSVVVLTGATRSLAWNLDSCVLQENLSAI